MLNAYRLGASLYVPATHHDLLNIANGTRWPALRSVIFCTEDAVAETALETAIENLRKALAQMTTTCAMLRFIRARNPDILMQLLTLPGIEKINGFVFPKFDLSNADVYMNLLTDSKYLCMPTLETRDVFETAKLITLRNHLLGCHYQHRILALRIGGNDLLSLLGIRRPLDRTIYCTPLGHTIAQIVTVFKPFGFQITAPVFEHLNCSEILQEELSEDIAHGLCGKTAIHPNQIPMIEKSFRVIPTDLEAAHRILNDDRAVFQFNGSMCEVATHRIWAQHILERMTIDS
ncbi:ATP-binding protein [Chromatium weissei]|nr:ATP-binding protein [Chromatium weissei]